MNRGKVSFVIAAYNEELFIEECIESCLNQEYPDIEVCVTDDGSIDKTWGILQKLAIDPRVKVDKFSENKGKVAAFNRSFSIATGDYIAIIGADDTNFPYRISSQVQHIRETRSDLVWGGLEVVDQALNHLSISLLKEPVITSVKSILEKNIVSGSAILMTRDFAAKIFPLPEKLKFEDWWIGYIAITKGKVSYSKDVIVKYRQHENNAAGGSDKSSVKQLRDNYLRHFHFYEEVKKDVICRYSGGEREKLLSVINGAIVYREVCLTDSFYKRCGLFIKNVPNLFSLSFVSSIKIMLITVTGISFFMGIKKVIKTFLSFVKSKS